MTQWWKGVGGALAVGFVLLASGCDRARSDARAAVRAQLRDGPSAIFSREVAGIDGARCGLVNAKNAFGAYVGPQPFVVEAHDQLDLAPGPVDFRSWSDANLRKLSLQANEDQAWSYDTAAEDQRIAGACRFVAHWQRLCAGASGIPMVKEAGDCSALPKFRRKYACASLRLLLDRYHIKGPPPAVCTAP